MSDDLAPKVKYTGSWGDYSGMGEANRNAIAALVEAGVEVQTEKTSYVKDKTDYGKTFRLCEKLVNNDIDYLFKIIHITPDVLIPTLEPLKYHIAHFFWETDRISSRWVWNLNLMNEVWTGSETTKEVLMMSGVKAPIYIFPQAIDNTIKPEKIKEFKIVHHQGFLFYSIFEWIERKNPKALLKAYWQEFENEENVSLFLKTYRRNFTSQKTFTSTEKNEIKKDIGEWKKEVDQKHFPRVFLCSDLLAKHSILKIHRTGDCFVSAHRGEGWGIPQAEAMTFANPVISTGYNGIHDWVNNDLMFLLKYKMIPVFNMQSNYYENDQKWADISISELMEKMRFVFDNQKKAREIGRKGRTFANNVFSYKSVGESMRNRLEKIMKEYL